MTNKQEINNAVQVMQAPRRFLVNLLSSLGVSIAQVLANLWLTPFLINYLGIAAFGMVALVNSVTVYLSIFTNALKSAVIRFLAIELKTNDIQTANNTFNTALFGIIGIAIVLSPAIIAISFLFNSIFNVPIGWEADSGWLFAFVSSTVFVAAIASNFAASPFIHSQFLAINVVKIISLFARISFLVTAFAFLPARLSYVGAGTLVYGIFFFAGSYVLWRKYTPELNIRLSAFTHSRLRLLNGMGGWVLVNQIGVMLLSRVDLIVVNAFFGATMTGGYGSVAQFSVFIGLLANVASDVVKPIVLSKYAQGDVSRLQHLISQSVKLLGVALALPVGFLCGYSRPLLRIWLGPSFEHLSFLLIILVSYLSLTLSVSPLMNVHHAYNKVKWPGILTLVSGGVNLSLAILIASWGKWGVLGVALVGMFVWIAKSALFNPIYAAIIMSLPWWSFLPNLSYSIVGTLFVGVLTYGVTLFQLPDNWLTLISSGTIVSILYSFAVWMVCLNHTDKQLLTDLLPSQVKEAIRFSKAEV